VCYDIKRHNSLTSHWHCQLVTSEVYSLAVKNTKEAHSLNALSVETSMSPQPVSESPTLVEQALFRLLSYAAWNAGTMGANFEDEIDLEQAN
jgi:hypothetical protein